jgi:hypothetical protein
MNLVVWDFRELKAEKEQVVMPKYDLGFDLVDHR